MKDDHVTVNLNKYESDRLRRIMMKLNIKTKSKYLRDLINAYYTQFIMGKEIEK